MKILVVFYSRTGSTKKIGEEIAKGVAADTEEIVDLKKRSGIIGWFASGKDAMQRKTTNINIKKNPQDYDCVIIGTPIWASNMAPAVRSYLKSHKLDNKKVNFFCTARGSGIEKTFSEMKKLVPNSDIGKNLVVLSREIKSGEYKEKVKSFLKINNQ
ncbi:hypothetical protein GOV14_02380 [Candidatus Pacearchaeota archaeon]|nr:hypothetical protein [Candidatus Pacearchaeota archaeon]